MKMTCWWNNDPKLASEVDAQRDGLLELTGRVQLPETGEWAEVPTHWLHTIEPEIKPGTLVYCWDGAHRPDHPMTAYYARTEEPGHFVDYDDNNRGIFYDHVQPISIEPKIDWSLLTDHDTTVVRFDSGMMYPCLARAWEAGMKGDWGTVIAVYHRPKEEGGKK